VKELRVKGRNRFAGQGYFLFFFLILEIDQMKESVFARESGWD